MPTLPAERPKASSEQETVEHILNSKLFANAPLLSAFLAFICRRVLEDGTVRISEQEIGVNVFHRAKGYDPGEDNIVRNYARQLRKRLAEYYSSDGQFDALRIEIPKGGYIPRFLPNAKLVEQPFEREPEAIETALDSPITPEIASQPKKRSTGISIPVFLLCSIVVCLVTFYATKHYGAAARTTNVMTPLWSQLFSHDKDTFLVPADAAFVTIREITGKEFSLAEYENGMTADGVEPDYLTRLKTRKFTSVLDIEIIAKLERLPEVVWNRCIIRAARSLRSEDLKNGNAILIGSVSAMPWVEAFQSSLNFHFAYKPTQNRAWIENAKPLPGEATIYASDWGGFSKKTYAVIAFLPNLNRTGHVLLIQGLDGAGTEAATDLLLNGDGFREIMDKAKRPDGTLGSFEALIEANAIDNHATTTHIAALRTPN